MIPFNDFVSDRRIECILCRMRVQAANQRHHVHLLHNLSSEKHFLPIRDAELYELFPPRKEWQALKPENRGVNICNNQGRQVRYPINTLDKNLKSLRVTLKHLRTVDPDNEYLLKLSRFYSEVRKMCCDVSYSIQSPKTYAQVKQDTKLTNEGRQECRPICCFESLKDRVIIKLVNQYLTILFDPYFINDNSLAFRAKRTYCGEDNVYTTHHHSIDRIQTYLDEHKRANIYVAECDIKKFYDSVNHKIIKNQFYFFLAKVKRDYPELSFTAIEHLFLSYLNCFTFPKVVYSCNRKPVYWKEQKVENGFFKWIEDDLIENKLCKSRRSICQLKIGIPQGGAISGVIANLVLDYADRKVLNDNDKHCLYIRYCDDMILLHTNKKKCERKLSIYKKSLSDVCLIPHKFEPVEFKTESFWRAKSKPIYSWGHDSNWIGFVGYEIKRTGEIRIRKKSLQKELNKQIEVRKKLEKIARHSLNSSKETLQESLNHRLLGMSVGRISLWNHGHTPYDLCWVNGFKKINWNKYSKYQLQRLDSNRNKQMIRLKKVISKYPEQKQDFSLLFEKKTVTKFYGNPFSYYFNALNSHKRG